MALFDSNLSSFQFTFRANDQQLQSQQALDPDSSEPRKKQRVLKINPPRGPPPEHDQELLSPTVPRRRLSKEVLGREQAKRKLSSTALPPDSLALVEKPAREPVVKLVRGRRIAVPRFFNRTPPVVPSHKRRRVDSLDPERSPPPPPPAPAPVTGSPAPAPLYKKWRTGDPVTAAHANAFRALMSIGANTDGEDSSCQPASPPPMTENERVTMQETRLRRFAPRSAPTVATRIVRPAGLGVYIPPTNVVVRAALPAVAVPQQRQQQPPHAWDKLRPFVLKLRAPRPVFGRDGGLVGSRGDRSHGRRAMTHNQQPAGEDEYGNATVPRKTPMAKTVHGGTMPQHKQPAAQDKYGSATVPPKAPKAEKEEEEVEVTTGSGLAESVAHGSAMPQTEQQPLRRSSRKRRAAPRFDEEDFDSMKRRRKCRS